MQEHEDHDHKPKQTHSINSGIHPTHAYSNQLYIYIYTEQEVSRQYTCVTIVSILEIPVGRMRG